MFINLKLVAYVTGRINTVEMLLISVIAWFGYYNGQITVKLLLN
jgi:hypothetical protein